MEAIMKMARSDLSEKLKDRRKKIDLIDRRLLKLLNQRLIVALEIGKIKREIGEKVYDPKREKEVLRKLKIKNRGPLKEKDLEKVFRTIMKVCRRSQKGVNSRTPL
jgi:chorismate mutase/prephenate dehydratase